MTSFVYPANILGLAFGVVRTPIWNTGEQVALSRKRSTIAYMAYPAIHFELEYELLRDDLTTSDLKAIVGLFNACQGKAGTFLFTDPDFNTFSSSNQQSFGTGDGTTTIFQLVAQYQNAGGPGYSELIQNLNGTPVLYNNGTIIGSGYVIGPTGIVTFSTAPLAGHALTWSGSFYYRCAFDEDKLDLSKFLNQWWKGKNVAFTSIKL